MARIAFIHLTFSWPPMGGSTIDIHEIMARARQHHEIKLFVPRFPGGFSRCDIRGELPYPIEKIPFSPVAFNFRTIGGRFKKSVESFKPDLVFIGDGWHLKPWLFREFQDYSPILRIYTYENLCLLRNGILFRNGAGCTNTFLDDPGTCRRCILLRRQRAFWYRFEQISSLCFMTRYQNLVQEMLRSARSIIVYNQFTKQLISRFNQQVLVIPSGVNPVRFSPSPEPQNQPILIFAPGRMDDPCKGLDLLLASLDRLHDSGVKFQLQVTGSVRRERAYMVNLGWIRSEAMPSLYARSNIIAVPALWPEPQGIVVLEALASGRPVVATAVGGIPDMIRSGENSLLCTATTESMASALNNLITDSSLRNKLGANARVTIEQSYGWDTIYRTHYEPLFQ